MDKYERFWKVLSNKEKDKIMQAYGEIASTPGNVIVSMDYTEYESQDHTDKENFDWVLNFIPDECTLKVLCRSLNEVDDPENIGYVFEAVPDQDDNSFCIVVSARGKSNKKKELGVIWFDFDDESDAKRVLSVVKWLNSHLK